MFLEKVGVISKILFLLLISFASCSQSEKSKRLSRVAIVGPTHFTALKAENIREGKNGKSRSWLKQAAKRNMNKIILLVNKLQPDALIIHGSLTWTGSEADYQELLPFLARIKVPVYLTGGRKDLENDPELEVLKRLFGDKYRGGKSLQFAGLLRLFSVPVNINNKKKLAKTINWLKAEFAKLAKNQPVLILGNPNFTKIKDKLFLKEYKNIVNDKRVSGIVESSQYTYLKGTRSRPIWSPPCPGWSGRGGIGMINIYKNKMVLENIYELNQPQLTVTVNYLKKDAQNSESDKIVLKPQLTIVQISDPQIGYPNVKRNTAQFQRAVNEINKLNPTPNHVFITGDLVHDNRKEEWDSYQKVAESIKAPRHTLPGNHDVLFLYDGFLDFYKDAVKKSPEKAKLACELASTIPGDNPLRVYSKFTKEKLYRYTIEEKGSVFITIPTLTEKIEPGDLEWLGSELERTKKAKHVFVLTHYPVLPYFGANVRPEEGGKEFLFLMKKYKVALVLNGHRHVFGYKKHEETLHIVCNRPKKKYLIYKIFPEKIIIEIRVPGKEIYQQIEILEPRI